MIRSNISSQLDKFVLEAAEKYDVPYYRILSKSRRDKIVKARNYAIHKMLINTDARLRECGEFLGNRTPAAIHHAFQTRYF